MNDDEENIKLIIAKKLYESQENETRVVVSYETMCGTNPSQMREWKQKYQKNLCIHLREGFFPHFFFSLDATVHRFGWFMAHTLCNIKLK